MEIIRADHYATCFGVDRALEITNDALELEDQLFCYGELIHNNDVLESLKCKGLHIIEDINDLKDSSLVIRSHGVGHSVYDYCEKNNIRIIDATCPKVRRIHGIVRQCCDDGDDIIIFGNKDHPEVEGIKGWCEKGVYIYSDLNDYKINHLYAENKTCIVFQTTYNINKYNEIKEYFYSLNNNAIIVKDTVCRATELRQEAAKKLAVECDSVLVIGGKQSSNTKKLYEICKELCDNTYWIENSDEIPYDLIKNSKKIGITAGASTPLRIVEEVIVNVRTK